MCLNKVYMFYIIYTEGFHGLTIVHTIVNMKNFDL